MYRKCKYSNSDNNGGQLDGKLTCVIIRHWLPGLNVKIGSQNSSVTW